jgi:hypothetical protein
MYGLPLDHGESDVGGLLLLCKLAGPVLDRLSRPVIGLGKFGLWRAMWVTWMAVGMLLTRRVCTEGP